MSEREGALYTTGGLVMKKFDVIVGNPPYPDVNNKRAPLWQKFAVNSIKLCKEGGYICLVHPANWRKPDHELFEILKKKDFKYLEIHNQQDGQKVFGAGTRYDWYVMCNQPNEPNASKTIILEEDGKQAEMNLMDSQFIPNFSIDLVTKLCVGGEKFHIIYNRSDYASDKKWMKAEQNAEFQYPCVHSTLVDGPQFWFSNTNKNGMFGQKKVIAGLSNSWNCIFDKDGKFGITQNCFGIEVDTDEEGENILRAMRSDNYKKFVKAIIWSGFAVDWRVFQFFRKDFWKAFVDENGNEIPVEKK